MKKPILAALLLYIIVIIGTVFGQKDTGTCGTVYVPSSETEETVSAFRDLGCYKFILTENPEEARPRYVLIESFVN